MLKSIPFNYGCYRIYRLWIFMSNYPGFFCDISRSLYIWALIQTEPEQRKNAEMPSRKKAQGESAAGEDADIVISGLSGKLPESSNIEEFKYNLLNGIDMVTDEPRRWEAGKYQAYITLIYEIFGGVDTKCKLMAKIPYIQRVSSSKSGQKRSQS